MKRLLALFVSALAPPAVLVVPLVLAKPMTAQWLNYPTPGIPRTADGKPNLSAPAPRTADGKPDLSGVWDPADKLPCPPEGCNCGGAAQQFIDIAWGVKDGLPYRPGIAEQAKARSAPPKTDEPITRCLPQGIVERHTDPRFRKIVQTPGLLLILNEYNKMYRQIFTDGRPLPADMQPTWDGYSIGKWDGDTLIVQTSGFRDGIWLDTRANPLTDAGKITERFRRVNYGRLEIEVTVDDPKAYTKPWTVKLNQTLQPDTDLIDFICAENEKDIKHMVAK